jgi:2-methylcitrate dehydratase PrpD
VEVEAHTTDGRTETLRVDVAPGHPGRELTWEEVRDKFMDCAMHGHVDAGRAERALAQIMRLEECTDVSRVVDWLTAN